MHSFIHTEADRKRMTDSCVDLVNKYGDIFDGIDLDLEYPCLPDDKACGDNITPSQNDKEHFALFIEYFRQKMGGANSQKKLTLATSAAENKI